MLHETFLGAFERLLYCRRRYDELDRTVEPVHRLASVRAELDDARDAVRRARLMHHPEADEIASGGTVVHCDHLARLVHLVADSAGRTRCACGEVTEGVGLSR